MTYSNTRGTPWQGAPPPSQEEQTPVMLLVYPRDETRYVRLADRGRRVLAALIDFVLSRIPLLILTTLFISRFLNSMDWPILPDTFSFGTPHMDFYLEPGQIASSVWTLLTGLLWYKLASVVLDVLYYMVVPLVAGGRTFGKMMLGLRPVGMNGYFLSKGRIVLRQLVGFRLLGSLSMGITTIISVIMILTTDYARGIHDYMADSAVIDERQN